jgi:hypothetical protein
MNDLIDRRLVDEDVHGYVDRREQCGSQSRDLDVVPVSVARVTRPLGEVGA